MPGSRMIKPFMQHEIELECPYYEPEFLSSICSIPYPQLKEIGNKPGLIWRIFKKDFMELGFDEKLVKNCKKIRLQDASDHGEYGISSVLVAKVRSRKNA